MRNLRLSLIAAALLGCTGARAQLAETSPFLPPGSANGPGAVDENQLQLTGILSLPSGEHLYSIFDPGRKTSEWSAVRQKGHAFMIRSADPRRETVTVECEGRVMSLELREAKVIPLNAGPGALQAANPASKAEETARLQAIAAEVQRRRLLREQAASQAGRSAPAADTTRRQGGRNPQGQPMDPPDMPPGPPP